MEILIGIIVWLLRRLFGETEKPAEMDESRRGEAPRPRTSSSSSSAPTLEELLAEVRREAEDKRRQQSEETRAPQQPVERPQPVFRRAESSQEELDQVQKAERAERRKRQERLERERLEHERVLEKSPAPVGSDLEKREIKSTLEIPTLEAITPMVEPKNEVILPKNKQSKQRRHQKAAVVPAQQPGGAPLPASVAVAEMLQTIRKGSGEERRQIAQQAFVLNEIFGPCRYHRRYAPPPRV